jgi:predicted secreted hydrolase
MPSSAAAALLAAALSAAGPPASEWRPVEPGRRWSFPRDHFSHPGYRTEWWYFTGHLEAAGPPAKELGFQFTFFRVGLLPERPAIDSAWAAANLVMGHAAVTDPAEGRHRFSEVLWREAPLLGAFAPFPGRPLAWSLAPAGSDGRWTLDWTGREFEVAMEDREQGIAYRISLRPEKPLVFHGPDGISRKSDQPGYASLYYSFTRLAVEGTAAVGGRTFAVRGRAWMDHEVASAQLAPDQVGWDWFALQLADGRDLMVYQLRRADGSVSHQSATVVGADGSARWLDAGAVTVRVTRRWRSPASGASYPAGWEIEAPSEGLRLVVEPSLADQENRARRPPGLAYWEGSVRVRDARGGDAGRGYVELTGYAPGSRLPL